MSAGPEIVGTVYGHVYFPDHPEHVGHGGLVGGEDVYATRATFRSPGEAMTWCRKVMDGLLQPAARPYGLLLEPRTPPEWREAIVTATQGEHEWRWSAEPNRLRDWRERDWDDRLGPTVRIDPDPEGATR